MAKILIKVDLEAEEELHLSHSTLEFAEVEATYNASPGPRLRIIKINVESWEKFPEENQP